MIEQDIKKIRDDIKSLHQYEYLVPNSGGGTVTSVSIREVLEILTAVLTSPVDPKKFGGFCKDRMESIEDSSLNHERSNGGRQDLYLNGKLSAYREILDEFGGE